MQKSAIILAALCWAAGPADYLQAETDNSGARFSRGGEKFGPGNKQETIQDVTGEIELDAKLSATYRKRGRIKFALGDYQGAIRDYTEAIRLDPKDAEACFGRGSTRAQLGDYREAIADYTKSLEIEPEDARVYGNRALARAMLEDHRGAVRDFTRALELDPGYAEAYRHRGTARGRLGDYQGAIEDSSRAIELNPKDFVAYHNRGLARYSLGDGEGARRDWRKSGELGNLHAGKMIEKVSTDTGLALWRRNLYGVPPAAEEEFEIINLRYDGEKESGEIAVRTGGRSEDCRKWARRKIEGLRVAGDSAAGTEGGPREDASCRVLEEKIKDDVLTIRFEFAPGLSPGPSAGPRAEEF
jgi:tetratricopeptide (TPR) repeat protein